MEILFHPRNDEGGLILPPEQKVSQKQFLYDLAVRRGLPHDRAVVWVGERIREAMEPYLKQPAPPTPPALPEKPRKRGRRG